MSFFWPISTVGKNWKMVLGMAVQSLLQVLWNEASVETSHLLSASPNHLSPGNTGGDGRFYCGALLFGREFSFVFYQFVISGFISRPS